jgi:hypothetical protein
MLSANKLVLPVITTLNVAIAHAHYQIYKKISKESLVRYDPLFIVS